MVSLLMDSVTNFELTGIFIVKQLLPQKVVVLLLAPVACDFAVNAYVT